jgi:hypothetical protein
MSGNTSLHLLSRNENAAGFFTANDQHKKTATRQSQHRKAGAAASDHGEKQLRSYIL